MKVNYNKKFYSKDGTFYNQTIRVNFFELERILKAIIEEKDNKYINYKNYCCNGVNYANMFLMHPQECEKELFKNSCNYFLNITTTSFIKHLFNNERIKTNKNTILIYDYKL